MNKESLFFYRDIGDKRGSAYSLRNLGEIAYAEGDYSAAYGLFEEGLGLLREVGDRPAIAGLLHNQGMVADAQGDYASAHSFYAQNLELDRELGDTAGIAETLEALATLAVHEQKLQRSARLWGAAEALYPEIHADRSLNEREKYDREVAQIRSALGEDAFAAAWEEGRLLGWEQALSDALT